MEEDAAAVRVAVRIRPLIGREKVERCDECVSVLEEENQIVMGKNHAFTYDYVFGKYAQQSDIYRCVDPLVKATFDGYNSTIFAYGQTGSGKTFTMGSGSSVHISPEDYGIIPRVISYMFEHLDAQKLENPRYKAELRIRFLEIYGEEIHDLLVTLGNSSGESKVTLREVESGEVQVAGASEVRVMDADDCMRLLERGTLCRTTGSTLMNAQSSRSHAIFTVTMVQHIPIGEPSDGAASAEGDFETRHSYFNFVDLAGSERQKRTQAEGKRLKEGIDINKGLLALGNVISALGDDKKRGRVHVPYRDSKLTRMLQDSLGGNSRTLMLACVSPADVNFEETLNALKYANRARNIQNKPVVNRDEASAMTMELRRQVQALQMEVHRLRNPGLSESELKMETVGTNLIGMQSDFDSFGNLRSRAETAENEVARLTSELKRGKTQLDHLKEEMIAAQAERDYLRLCVEEGATSGATGSAEDKEAKSSILKDHLRTICDLQEKLRVAEQERDRAVLNIDSSSTVSLGGGARPSTAPAFVLPSFAEADTKGGNELLERAQKEIEKEAALLKKLQEEESGDEPEVGSDGSGAAGESSADDMEVEATEEEVELEQVFQRRQRHLGNSVQDLAHDISLKEQLVQNIRQAQENYDRLKTFYEQKMAQMVEEVRVAQGDRDRLVDEIQQLEQKIKAEGGDSTGGNGRLSKLSRDLKGKEEELQMLRKKQSEMNRFMNQKKKNEMQLRVLNSEISNMKRQKVDLMKKMKDERKNFQEEAKQRRREIMGLKRSQQRDKQQIQRLGSQKDAQERVLKRKMEEMAATKQRLKHQQQLTAQARKMNATHGRKKSSSANRADRDAKWLSEEVKKQAQEQHKLEQLQKEREAVAKEMEALYAQRDKLESEVQSSISAQTSIRDVLTSPLKTSPLSRRNSAGKDQLTPAEEQLLYDLEERIEACQAQLEYKEEKISEIADDGRNIDAGNALVKIETTQSLPEARTLLKMLFGMAVDVKKQDQSKERELAKQQEEMKDLVSHLQQEREKTLQIKQSYEESLQRVVNGGSSSNEDASGAHEPLDERSRILLSVSEERNAVLRKKCEELETASHTTDQEKREMAARLRQEQQALAASRERIQHLESQLSGLKGARQSSQSGRGRSRIPISSSARGKLPPSTAPSSSGLSTTSGPVSWANDFDDDDEDMATDEHEDENEDVVMRSDDESLIPRSGQDRRRFRMELDSMEDHMGSVSLSQKNRRAQITLRRREDDADEQGQLLDDEPGEDGQMYREDSPPIGSDDSSSTGAASKSIFSRLSNPTNFTGIHKNRVRESASKREILQTRSERNRSRRLKDKGQLKPSRSMNTPTEPLMGTAGGFKNPPSSKPNSVLEVLANMKRENESEQYVSSSGLRQPLSYVTTDRPREYASDDNDQAVTQDDGFGVMPPPAPQGDVYSRLAGQYTASAQNKRQHAPTSVRRPKGNEADGATRSGLQGIDLEDDAYLIDQHGEDSANYTGDEADDEAFSSNYDPLLGGDGSLVTQVHKDYQERLNERNTANRGE